jgi:hypothetical protein
MRPGRSYFQFRSSTRFARAVKRAAWFSRSGARRVVAVIAAFGVASPRIVAPMLCYSSAFGFGAVTLPLANCRRKADNGDALNQSISFARRVNGSETKR